MSVFGVKTGAVTCNTLNTAIGVRTEALNAKKKKFCSDETIIINNRKQAWHIGFNF